MSQQSRGRVLVVDDDPAMRTLVSQFLSDEGYQVAEARSVPCALAVSVQHAPRLVLLDVQLHGTGTNGAQLLRARLPDARIVAVSGLPDFGGDRVLAHVDGTLAKPFDLDDLLAVVRHVSAGETGQRQG
jgi:DNA-binding response OmpR family regulator